MTPILSAPSIWSIRLDITNLDVKISIEGDGCFLIEGVSGRTISWSSMGKMQPFMFIDAYQASIVAPGGYVFPIYFRKIGQSLFFSNVASMLIRQGDVLKINTSVLLQNLTGTPTPRSNIFKDILLLEASAKYLATASGLSRIGTALSESRGVNADAALDIVFNEWNSYLSSGRDVAVLLSGGYDSRLNLAIACNAAKRYGNKILAFHEYKNKYEESIAIQVANAANIELIIRGREDFVSNEHSVILDPKFINIQSGFYRRNIIRWHSYLTYINSIMPNCIIMGMGAEAHKGKYYNQIDSVESDCQRVFGLDTRRTDYIYKKFKINNYYSESEKLYFQSLFEFASEFNTLDSKVDYIHYQTYIANGYGFRCHDFHLYFNIEFPFLDNRFLAAVFSLPRKEKEGFALVLKGIDRLMPLFNNIQYTSANEKSLRPIKRTYFHDVKAKIMGIIRPIQLRILPPRKKNRLSLTNSERDYLMSLSPRSKVVKVLVENALKFDGSVPFLNLVCLVQISLYLEQVERVHSAELLFD